MKTTKAGKVINPFTKRAIQIGGKVFRSLPQHIQESLLPKKEEKSEELTVPQRSEKSDSVHTPSEKKEEKKSTPETTTVVKTPETIVKTPKTTTVVKTSKSTTVVKTSKPTDFAARVASKGIVASVIDLWQDQIVDGYEIKTLLGRGTYGCVFQAQSITACTKLIAIKITASPLYLKQEDLDEVLFLKYIKHPNILTLLGYKQVMKEGATFLLLFMPLAKCNLQQYLDQQTTKIKEGKADPKKEWEWKTRIAEQMYCGLWFMWKNGFGHFDLKPSNVLVFENDVIQLGDFSFVQPLFSNHTGMMHTMLYSNFWRPPEMWCSFPKSFWTYKCDLWAFGLILAQIYFHLPPPSYSTTSEAIKKMDTYFGLTPKFLNLAMSLPLPQSTLMLLQPYALKATETKLDAKECLIRFAHASDLERFNKFVVRKQTIWGEDNINQVLRTLQSCWQTLPSQRHAHHAWLKSKNCIESVHVFKLKQEQSEKDVESLTLLYPMFRKLPEHVREIAITLVKHSVHRQTLTTEILKTIVHAAEMVAVEKSTEHGKPISTKDIRDAQQVLHEMDYDVWKFLFVEAASFSSSSSSSSSSTN